jgi:monooxygenase
MEHLDVLVIGAGISGIAAGYHLQTKCPRKSYAILESRGAIGGTWDLFRYPGIRSDSDMYTLGYSFRPWMGERAIADGPSILAYVRETARAYGIDAKIRFGHRIVGASWSEERATWTVEVERKDTGETQHISCNFLLVCAGYYDYDEGHTPDFPGIERFLGRVVHPQKWTDDIRYDGLRVIVIGSGATAVTLVPELAKRAAHVTMLQRSPTYVISLPAVDGIAARLNAALPSKAAYGAVRWKNVLLGMAFYNFCRKFPDQAKRLITARVKEELGGDFDVATHFNPRYRPWDQRVCLVPDGDLFRSIKSGKAEVVTDRIETFTATGLMLESGRSIEADLVVTATGLKLRFLGGMRLTVDGRDVRPESTMNYKGAMLSEVPNMAMTFGYTNASWTLKCDLTCEYVTRVLNYMERGGHRRCVARRKDPSVREEPLIDFSSGYIQRALADAPKQGSKAPWKLYQNYALDIAWLRYGAVDDGVLEFR